MALDLSKEIGHSFIPRKKVENWKGRVVVRSIRIELAMAEEPENDGGALTYNAEWPGWSVDAWTPLYPKFVELMNNLNHFMRDNNLYWNERAK